MEGDGRSLGLVIEEGYDLVIRVNPAPDQTLVGRAFLHDRLVVVAGPDIATARRNGRPSGGPQCRPRTKLVRYRAAGTGGNRDRSGAAAVLDGHDPRCSAGGYRRGTPAANDRAC